ncbi:MAG: hypothetical protein ACOCP8_05990, partial [archaeon]
EEVGEVIDLEISSDFSGKIKLLCLERELFLSWDYLKENNKFFKISYKNENGKSVDIKKIETSFPISKIDELDEIIKQYVETIKKELG